MIAKTIGQTTHEAIASTSAAMALPEVETCSPWLGAAAGHVGSGGDWGVSDTAKPYPPTTDSATPQHGLLAERTPAQVHRRSGKKKRGSHLDRCPAVLMRLVVVAAAELELLQRHGGTRGCTERGVVHVLIA